MSLNHTRPPLALSVHDLTVIYNGEPALDGVSFDVQAGERVAVIGPNGAGKSTLIKTIMGLLQPRSGSVQLHTGNPLGLGYVPQYEDVNWDFPVTVRDVVMMGQTRRIGWLRWPSREAWARVEQALDRVGMTDLAGRQVGELSGGQRRRVFIARALAQQADILVLDEPFSGVDAHAQSTMMDVLDSLNADGMTIILSTHDLNLAFRRFDKVLAIRQQMLAYGDPEAVYRPDILSQLYGGQIATLEDGRHVTVFVDDHDCC
ncbi:MAG: metal ABC transporter ATP-binding protein [Anaerolineae bacterium]|nr:metal ABC transporter ATP-binding protein [Anaerolineae bacterium]